MTREMGRIYHAKGVERLVRNDLWTGPHARALLRRARVAVRLERRPCCRLARRAQVAHDRLRRHRAGPRRDRQRRGLSAREARRARAGSRSPCAAARPGLVAWRHADHPLCDRRRRALHAAGAALARDLARDRARDRRRPARRNAACSCCRAAARPRSRTCRVFSPTPSRRRSATASPHRMLDAAALRAAFPAFAVADDARRLFRAGRRLRAARGRGAGATRAGGAPRRDAAHARDRARIRRHGRRRQRDDRPRDVHAPAR